MKARSLFENVEFLNTETIVEGPKYIDGGLTMIWVENQRELNDGNKVIECLWTDTETHYDLWEIDLCQKEQNYKTVEEVAAYLKSKGFYLHDVELVYGTLWHYSGIKQYDDKFRLTYYFDDV